MDGSRAQLVRQPVGRSVATGGLVADLGKRAQQALAKVGRYELLTDEERAENLRHPKAKADG